MTRKKEYSLSKTDVKLSVPLELWLKSPTLFSLPVRAMKITKLSVMSNIISMIKKKLLHVFNIVGYYVLLFVFLS